VVYFLNIHSFAGTASDSLNPSLVAGNHPQCIPIGYYPRYSPRALALALDWSQPDQEQEQEQEQEANLNRRCSEISRFDGVSPYTGFGPQARN